jgi:hypothetical protein
MAVLERFFEGTPDPEPPFEADLGRSNRLMGWSPATKRRRRAEAAGPYPRPQGAAPKGANNRRKLWDKENGVWKEDVSTSTQFASWPSSMGTFAQPSAGAALFFPSLPPPPSQPASVLSAPAISAPTISVPVLSVPVLSAPVLSAPGMLEKVQMIKDALGIPAAVPKDAVREANAQLGLEPCGALLAQVDALMQALGLPRHTAPFQQPLPQPQLHHPAMPPPALSASALPLPAPLPVMPPLAAATHALPLASAATARGSVS